jgi:hypothetical protein
MKKSRKSNTSFTTVPPSPIRSGASSSSAGRRKSPWPPVVFGALVGLAIGSALVSLAIQASLWALRFVSVTDLRLSYQQTSVIGCIVILWRVVDAAIMRTPRR